MAKPIPVLPLVGSIIVGKMQFLENSYRTTEINQVLNKIGVISAQFENLGDLVKMLIFAA